MDILRTSGGHSRGCLAQNFGQGGHILENQAFRRGHPCPEGIVSSRAPKAGHMKAGRSDVNFGAI